MWHSSMFWARDVLRRFERVSSDHCRAFDLEGGLRFPGHGAVEQGIQDGHASVEEHCSFGGYLDTWLEDEHAF
jgi:hypothetical protein